MREKKIPIAENNCTIMCIITYSEEFDSILYCIVGNFFSRLSSLFHLFEKIRQVMQQAKSLQKR